MQTHPLISTRTKADTVIIADGDFPRNEVALSILNSCRTLVCTDGAADTLVVHSLTPYVIVGDCDSISEESRRKFADRLCKIDEQDSNDLTKAVEWCISHEMTEATILGATGKREDHTIGNISLLADYMRRCRVRMVSDYGEFIPICEDTAFESFAGQQVSIFGLDPATKILYKGLKYDLPESRAKSWWSGTLNEALGERFEIHTTGEVIVFRAF